MSLALVTGGAGAIGGNVSRELIKRGFRVVVLDNLSSGFKGNIPKCRFINGDICDNKVLKKAFGYSPDVVFHLAANFANQNSVDHPEKDLRTNGLGTLRLLRFSRKNNCRFVYASSSCVYGNRPGSLREEHVSASLDTPYAFSKLLGEQYVNFFHANFGMWTSIVRYFNSYGPGEYPGRYRNVIPNFISIALKGKALPITGTGDETRDFTYVQDVVEGTLLSAEKESANGKTFNLGSGKETKIKVLAAKINEITGNNAGVEFVKRREWDHISRRLAYIGKSKKILGYNPKVGLDKGLKSTVEWFKGLR